MATTTNPPTDPTPSDPKVAAATLDFLLIELVPLAQRMAVELHARDTALLAASMDRNLALNTSTSGGALGLTSSSAAEKRQSVKSMGTNTAGGAGTNKDVEDEDEDEERRSEDVMWRLDALGYRVGQGLVERYASPSSIPYTPLPSTLTLTLTTIIPKNLPSTHLSPYLPPHQPQILRQHTPPNNPSGHDQIHLQRPLATGLPQTNRQSKNQPQRNFCADG